MLNMSGVYAKILGASPLMFGIYPSLWGGMVNVVAADDCPLSDLDIAELKSGEGVVVDIQEGKVKAVARLSNAFNAKGLISVTGTVQAMENDAQSTVGEKLVRANLNGISTVFTLTSSTNNLHAQQNMERKQKIYDSLKPGDSVNIFIDPKNCNCCSNVQFFSVNFR